MDFPFKYMVIVYKDSTFCESEHIYKYVDYDDAKEEMETAEHNGYKAVLLRVYQRVCFN